MLLLSEATIATILFFLLLLFYRIKFSAILLLSSREEVLLFSSVPLLSLLVFCNSCFLLETLLCSSSIPSCFLQLLLSLWRRCSVLFLFLFYASMFSAVVCFLLENVFCFLLLFLFYPFMFSAILAFFLRMCSLSLLFLYHPFEVFCSSCFLLENICSVSFFCFSSIP